MKLVIIESPFAGDIENNLAYAKLCVKDCLKRGEAPYASHLFFTQEGILDDLVPEERMLGIQAGLEWGKVSELVAVYIDNGISKGMKLGIEAAKNRRAAIMIRSLTREIDEQDYIDLGIE